MTFAETVDRVIDLGTRVWEYWDAELPKRHRDYPLVHEGEDSGPPPPEEAELRSLLQSLPPPELRRLITLMYLGRRYSTTADPAAVAREAAAHFPDPAEAASYLVGYPPLADELRDGLEVLARGGRAVDAFQAA